MKTGTVTIVGRPNVGKSTLLNALLKEKIAIISDKPQTTRTRILGVVHLADAQIVLLDTPGLHQAKDRLNQRMVRTAVETMREADLLYVMVEATAAPGPGDRFVIEQVREAISAGGRPAFLLINKVDLVSKPRVLPLIESYRTMMDWNEVVPLSAQTGLNVDRLLELTVKALPEGDPVYGEDVVTDQSMRTLAAEIIREKILQKTREEVPYSVAVEIDRFVEEGKLARIAATVLVEKESQKAIVIGKRGERLKAIGTYARIEMERLFGLKVFLELWVKVRPAWRQDELMLTELGY
ncbi:MAG: GTPase Era [Nitrospirae bacterium]|nr:MAG: GTPase Era [Nitrospirae bacterium 13_2_20CM_2_62_8]OLC43940.1 MAG: GTPase Era [Nitrospirae bacterium 13_1_40CM_4_62_6]OLD36812.1 MAG: GTPase Era [Nitrospirae bacterium 13_1_40CM_2_62_10]TLY41687.1 MAG: GTPase Era [Nitrospirota bacterium]TLY42276.1 MAG: GTPase Era [Nitrospirota bacterium]